MSTLRKMTRRAMLQIGLIVAGAATGKLFAKSTNANMSCETPAQTEGPFYPKHEQADKDLDLTLIKGHDKLAEGEIIYVSGQVIDDHYRPVPGALVDVWQANKHGRYHHEDDTNPAPMDDNFQGWGQIRADGEGRYSFKTIIPGAYPVDEEWSRPPHIHFKVSKRGYHELITQMYFADHALNEKDRILLELPDSERGKVIVEFGAGLADDEPDAKRGQFNIMLRRVRKA